MADYIILFDLGVEVAGAQTPEDAVYAASVAVYKRFVLDELRRRLKFQKCEEKPKDETRHSLDMSG